MPPKPPKPKMPEYLKSVVKTKADEFVESFLKPLFIKEPPKDYQWNYPVDIFTRWYQRYFYYRYCLPVIGNLARSLSRLADRLGLNCVNAGRSNER